MAASIQTDMKELKAIVSELKAVNAKAKELRTRKKQLESQIDKYLEDTEQPGVKYGDLIVLRAESTVHKRLKKKEKEENVIKVLEDNGITETEKLYDAISKAMVGEEETKSKLRIKMSVPDLA